MRIDAPPLNRAPLILRLVALVAGFLSLSCGGSLFHVKPAVTRPLPDSAKRAEASGLTVRAVPMLVDEENQELFEANLPLNGILPVRVELANNTEAPIEIDKARFGLKDAGGGTWKPLNVKEAVSRIMSANGIYAYNPSSKNALKEAVAAHALDVKTALAPKEHRQGLIFFRTPHKEPVESPAGLTLTIERLQAPIEIRLT